jgi:hypothetical protein
MNDSQPPSDVAEDIRAALNSRLRIAIDYAVRVMRSRDAAAACDGVVRLYEEVGKAKRLAEEWSASPSSKSHP